MKKITEYTLPELQKAFADKFAEKLEDEFEDRHFNLNDTYIIDDFHEFFLENEVDDLKFLIKGKVKYYKDFHCAGNENDRDDWRD